MNFLWKEILFNTLTRKMLDIDGLVYSYDTIQALRREERHGCKI